MIYIKFIVVFLLLSSRVSATISSVDGNFEIRKGQKMSVYCDSSEEEVVHTALELLKADFGKVLKTDIELTSDSNKGNLSLVVGTVTVSPLLRQLVEQKEIDISVFEAKKESFLLCVKKFRGKSVLIVCGSDKRGTAYGILEISRLLGISPWEWWADISVEPLVSFSLPIEYMDVQSPSVEYRGIFINDEDFGFMPWATRTYDPTPVRGKIGPKTYSKVFELLLRLRANCIWPAMHSCTVPFYLVPGNKEMAEKYGIYVGTSHCEPLNCNVNGEWKRRGKGKYNYMTNRDSILDFFEDRVKEIHRYDNIYTIGMRGLHDGWMQGVERNPVAQAKVLPNVFHDQRNILQKYICKDISQIPQIFVPYKEVLDVYHANLQIPDDVTIMWCNDNYGYNLRYPTLQEKRRRGGFGMYYHIAYWYYLWIPPRHPGLMFYEMMRAYDEDVRKIWMLNVGDIKLGEYLIELFLDMAWDIEGVRKQGPENHLYRWVEHNLGKDNASLITDLLWEYNRLNWIRMPEFVQARTNYPPVYRPDGDVGVRKRYLDPDIADTDFTQAEVEERLEDFDNLERRLDDLHGKIPNNRQASFFELVEYPLKGVTLLNRKILKAQYARHDLCSWEEVDSLHEALLTLTQRYDTVAGGKWKYMAGPIPRKMFLPIKHERFDGPAFFTGYKDSLLVELQGIEAQTKLHQAWKMGYKGQAAIIPKGMKATFCFSVEQSPEIIVRVANIPIHPGNGDQMRYRISVDGGAEKELNCWEKDITKPWEKNVIRNQNIRESCHSLSASKTHKLTIEAIDADILLDRIQIFKIK